MRVVRTGVPAVLAAAVVASLGAACGGETPREAEPPKTSPPEIEPPGSSVREGYLEGAEGARIHYRLLGAGSDTVVVLHGGPGAGIHSVLSVLEPLAKRVALLFYDQRGGGRSELPADTSLLHARYHVEDLEAVRRHFGLQRLKLLTHSFGAILAARYAQRYPERVERMVFHGATGPERSEAARLARASPPSPDTALSKRQGRLLRSLLEGTAADPVATCREFEALGRRLAEARGEKVTWNGTSCAAPPEAVRYYFRHTAQLGPRSFGDWDFTSGLEQVSAPLLVVHGERDTVGLPANRAWAAALPNGRLLIIRGATTPSSDRPEESFRAIATFMKGEWPADAVTRVVDRRAVVYLEAGSREPEAIAPIALSADTDLVARDFDTNRVGESRSAGEPRSTVEPGSCSADAPGLADVFRRVDRLLAERLDTLREAGALALDDPVREHLPWFEIGRPPETGEEPITIRHLLTHTSGLPRDSRLTDFSRLYQPPREAAIEALPSQRLEAAPGETYAYSNLGYGILGELIAEAGRSTYAGYLEREVLEPLGMTHTLVHPTSEDDTAWGHGPPRLDDRRPKAGFWELRFATPAGGIASSVAELSELMALQLAPYVGAGPRLLSADAIRKMHAVQHMVDPARGGSGLAWAVEIPRGRHLVYHGGELPEQTAFLLLDLRAHVGHVVLTNAEGADAQGMAREILELVRGPGLEPAGDSASSG